MERVGLPDRERVLADLLAPDGVGDRRVDLADGAHRPVVPELEHGQERLLRHLDAADLLHPLLALLLRSSSLRLREMSPP